MNSKDIAIKVEGISKRYRIGLKDEMHDSFSGALFGFIKSPLKNYRKHRSLYRFDDIKHDQPESSRDEDPDIIWAVRDVSFEVKEGVNGNIKRGKYTFPSILCPATRLSLACVIDCAM